jgi:hypothetical protein
LTQESECESRDGGWTALAKGPADYHTGHYSLFCRATFFPAVLQTAFSSSRVCANACGARSVEKLLYNPPLQQLGQKFFQVKFNENFCPMQMSLSHTFPLSCWRLVGESHLRLSCSASWLSCYSATVLPPFGVGAMTKRVFQSGTNPFSSEINSNIQY